MEKNPKIRHDTVLIFTEIRHGKNKKTKIRHGKKT